MNRFKDKNLEQEVHVCKRLCFFLKNNMLTGGEKANNRLLTVWVVLFHFKKHTKHISMYGCPENKANLEKLTPKC